jgi:Fe-S cluster assembly scaffold protein SufB
MATKNAKKNVKNVYELTDNKAPKICQMEEVEILPSQTAWQKYDWAKKYFNKRPKQGYFIWIKKDVASLISTCILIAKKNVSQDLQNLLVVEKNLNVKINGICRAQKKDLSGRHKARGKIILKENSFLKYEHIHSWGQKDSVEPDYQFFLGKNSKLDYLYKALQSPEKLKISTQMNIFKGASADLKMTVGASNSKTEINDSLILKEKNASGAIKLRLVGKEKSQITARSQVRAEAEGKGHLDCHGLLVGSPNNSFIKLIPQLICRNKKAQITHEASIGKISEEELNYLRMRGLTEKEAIDLIVNGFLEI